jgi:hypothetical protein
MQADRIWPIKVKAPTKTQIVEIFVAKSVWHDNHSKVFPLAMQYPIVLRWLKNEGDAPSDLEIFGKESNLYTFRDLREVLERLGKGKRKARGSVDEGSQKKKKGKKGKKRKSSVSMSP